MPIWKAIARTVAGELRREELVRCGNSFSTVYELGRVYGAERSAYHRTALTTQDVGYATRADVNLKGNIGDMYG
jgi:hypothetical protein